MCRESGIGNRDAPRRTPAPLLNFAARTLMGGHRPPAVLLGGFVPKKRVFVFFSKKKNGEVSSRDVTVPLT